MLEEAFKIQMGYLPSYWPILILSAQSFSFQLNEPYLIVYIAFKSLVSPRSIDEIHLQLRHARIGGNSERGRKPIWSASPTFPMKSPFSDSTTELIVSTTFPLGSAMYLSILPSCEIYTHMAIEGWIINFWTWSRQIGWNTKVHTLLHFGVDT